MKNLTQNWRWWWLASLMPVLLSCQAASSRQEGKPLLQEADTSGVAVAPAVQAPPPFDTLVVGYEVRLGHYFDFMDSVVATYDSLVDYDITEHLIVRSNPWIIDTLENTDYYRLKARGVFNYDNRLLVVLKKGDTLFIPNETDAWAWQKYQEQVVVDVNIPEFRLRIRDSSQTLYSFPVRVGLNKQRFLVLNDRVTDLRTVTGKGNMIRINRNPIFVDPEDGKRRTTTRRDDGKTTRMPQIPWMEPKLGGRRLGQLIHPTTNPKSLGKPYSSGCVGTREADAWRIYYYAPVGTAVIFRYDLEVVNEAGDTIRLKDIYGYSKKKEKTKNPG